MDLSAFVGNTDLPFSINLFEEMQKDSNAVFGRFGPRRPRLSDWTGRALRPALRKLLEHRGLHHPDSKLAHSRLAALERAIRAGQEAYVLGVNPQIHNSGAALVRVSERGCVELVCNEEEERYRAEKHCGQFPEHSIEIVKQRMRALGLGPEDLAACVGVGDYAQLFANHKRSTSLHAPARIGSQLGLGERMPLIAVRHHDCHAYLSYAVSPFAGGSDPVMTIVADGAGDDCAASLYTCQDSRVTLLSTQGTSRYDSLGTMYAVLSVTQGGWPPLSAEGRYMGATAWGDGNRLTNPYYRRLKHIFHFGAEGEVHLNRALANWARSSWSEPYSRELIDILGEPIPPAEIWNPDAILSVENIRHPEVTRNRVDKAAAVQMVFEDGLIHMVDHLIRTTGSHQLVLTGGTALNCLANMRLLECFDEDWYTRALGRKNTRLHLWVPPIPGDSGTPIGAAYAFAMRAGARPGPPLRHAFYCGIAPTTARIRAAVNAEPLADSMSLGDCSDPDVMARVADLLAYVVANDCIIGLYQGVSETGPRALGHRSILANPCNPDTRRLLNERVEHRELIRPLAPMCTRAAAERFFYLEDGASDGDYNAYNYMALTARARPEAHETIPAVIHHDGTGRPQIVRSDVDPFCHEFLVAMGRRVDVEVSVNTSLNVSAPIALTPEQAIDALKRAGGMDGLLTIGDDRQAALVWLTDRSEAHHRLMESLQAWAQETELALPDRGYLLGVDPA
jgi:carbamoyltransferase